GHRSRNLAMATIDEVVEGVRGGRLVAALFDLPETDVIDDEQGGGCPGLEAACVRAIGESCMEVVEQIDAAGVAPADPLLARAEAERLEDVTLAGAGLARDDEIVASSNEVGECQDRCRLKFTLEGPIRRGAGAARSKLSSRTPAPCSSSESLRCGGPARSSCAGADSIEPGAVVAPPRRRRGAQAGRGRRSLCGARREGRNRWHCVDARHCTSQRSARPTPMRRRWTRREFPGTRERTSACGRATPNRGCRC